MVICLPPKCNVTRRIRWLGRGSVAAMAPAAAIFDLDCTLPGASGRILAEALRAQRLVEHVQPYAWRLIDENRLLVPPVAEPHALAREQYGTCSTRRPCSFALASRSDCAAPMTTSRSVA